MRRGETGFTLIELMIVISIIGILTTLAIPSYERYTIRARETALQHQLLEIRRSLDAYRADRGRWPEDLRGLSEAGYLPQVPADPMTRKADWILMPPPAGEEGGVYEVHSRSDLIALDGTPYNEW